MHNYPNEKDTSDIKPKDTPTIQHVSEEESTETLKTLTLKELEKINLERIKGVHREGAD